MVVTVHSLMLATVQQIATAESALPVHHHCGPGTAQKIALTKVLLAVCSREDARVAMVVVADSAAVANLAGASAIQTAVAVAVADLLTVLDLPAVEVAKLPTLAPYAADISVAADVA